MRRYVMTGLLTLAALAAAGRASAAEVSVAVLGIEPIDVPEPLAQQLTDALRQRVSSTAGVRMVQGKDLIEVKMVFGCDGETPTCMAQAGKSLGADKLLYGMLKKGSNKSNVTVALKLLDVKTATVEKFVNDTVPKRELAGGTVNQSASRWFAQLLEVEAKPTLTVQSDPSGASVAVDGTPYGRTPLTLRDLGPGSHTVTLSMPGRQSASRTVDLRPGGSHDVVVSLEPEAPPPPVAHNEPKLPPAPEPQPLVTANPQPQPLKNAGHPGRTAQIIGIAAVGAAVVTGAVAIYTWRSYVGLEDTAHSELLQLRQPSVSASDAQFFANPNCNVPGTVASVNPTIANKYKGDCNSGNDLANATTGLWVATGVLAAGGVVSFILGEREAVKARRERDKSTVGVMRRTLRVAPIVSTQGGGIAAKFEF
jgi:hypothetical protein